MPYLDEAARQLGISEKTLRRWLRIVEPPITPTRHRYDRRYQLISEEDVEVIRVARSEKPGVTGVTQAPMLSVRSPQPNLAGVALADRESPQPPRQRPSAGALSASFFLPDGLVSRSELASQHGVPLTTMRRWCDEGHIETDSGVYAGASGRFSIAHPVTRHGQHQFYVLASARRDFVACSLCPHQASEGNG